MAADTKKALAPNQQPQQQQQGLAAAGSHQACSQTCCSACWTVWCPTSRQVGGLHWLVSGFVKD